MKEKIAAILKTLPERPGVYLMRDAEGKIIYVGKAIKLKRRVSSYFRHTHFSPRLNKLVSLIEDISIIRTETEAEALIVEAKLIRKYSPFFNIELKMSDKYPYIKVTDEDFPRLEITRHKQNDGAVYLGPFVDAGNIRDLMRLAERYFPLRVCRSKIKPDPDKRPCVEYNLGHSMGACAALCSKSEYRERVADLILLFEGKSAELVERLRERMKTYAGNLEFEKAAVCRDAIRAIWKLSRQKISSALQEDLDSETWNVLNEILDHDYDSGAVLWHCSEGKDRCGLISALVMMILDVDEKTIREDYLETNKTSIPKAEMIYKRIAESGDEEIAKSVYKALIADERYLNTALNSMTDNYLEDVLKLDKNKIEKFRNRILI